VSLLSLEHVTKRLRRGRLERTAVKDVSLEVEQAEMVAVWGPRRSGRSTLLRLAGGLELPEEGIVRFEGRDLARSRDAVLGRRLAYCQMSFASRGLGLVVEYVAQALLAQGASQRDALRRAEDALARVGVEHCAQFVCNELDGAEVARVAIASALVSAPALLIIDEPTSNVHQLERDPLLALLRSIANEGVAVLMSAGDTQSLGGVDRPLSIDNGELRGELSVSERVVPLRPVFGESGEMESGTRQR
jgi:ABC-type ATPase involved in cell division